MSRFRSTSTGVVVSVDDSKDDRFSNGWESADEPAPDKKTPAKKATSAKSGK